MTEFTIFDLAVLYFTFGSMMGIFVSQYIHSKVIRMQFEFLKKEIESVRDKK